MNTMDFMAGTNVGTGLLLLILSIPMILRKVAMNHLYGIRFSYSFKSDKNWYDINEAGGKILAVWSLLLILFGFYGFLLTPDKLVVYTMASVAFTMALAVGVSIHSYVAAKRIDRRNNEHGKN